MIHNSEKNIEKIIWVFQGLEGGGQNNRNIGKEYNEGCEKYNWINHVKNVGLENNTWKSPPNRLKIKIEKQKNQTVFMCIIF